MKSIVLVLIIIASSFLSLPSYSQSVEDEPLLGLPGDYLNLYAVLDLFQKSKTIEDFEKILNEEKTGINNLDLNLDNKVDFIKVVTKQKNESFSFALQVDISDKEIQDVAVILLDKEKDGKTTLQMVGDIDLYGKDYVIEPKTEPTPAITANPAYIGDHPVTVNVPATTRVVVVETIPVVQYVYSPVYVPYTPPYYYGYYPHYYSPFTVISIGRYRHNHYYCHRGYYGGHYGGYYDRHHGGHYGGKTVIINNSNNYNYYNDSRNSSITVSNNMDRGNYGRNTVSNRSSREAMSSSRGAEVRSVANRSSRGAASSSRSFEATPATNRSSREATSSSRTSTAKSTTKSTTSYAPRKSSSSSRSSAAAPKANRASEVATSSSRSKSRAPFSTRSETSTKTNSSTKAAPSVRSSSSSSVSRSTGTSNSSRSSSTGGTRSSSSSRSRESSRSSSGRTR